MTGHVAAICRHPVKGFTPEPLAHVDLAPAEGFAHDRVWAVENGPSGFDPAAPAFVPKQKFTVLMNLPRVAAACTRYDEASGVLRAEAPGLAPFAGRLAEPTGCAAFAAWLTGLLRDDIRGPLKVVAAPAAHRFTDHPKGQVSIVNLASVRELERTVGQPVNPLRFRANIYLDGLEPWQELDWLDHDITVGSTRLRVFHRTRRCEATNVDPATGARDLAIPSTLVRTWGHADFGVYAKVIAAGRIATGDPVNLV